MKRICIIISCAVALVLSGCRAAEPEQPAPEGKTVLTIGLSGAVRTVMGPVVNDERKVFWTDGDQVCVNGIASAPLADLPAEAEKADFTFSSALETPYNILYPASFYKNATTVTLPSSQSFAAGSFATNTLPLAARYTGDAGTPQLESIASVIGLSIKQAAGAARTLSSVTFKGNLEEQVCGDFTIDYGKPSLTGASTATDDKTVTLTVGQPLSDSAPLEVYLVVPSGTYSKGFTVTFTDDGGRVMKATKKTVTELSRGEVLTMAELTFRPAPLAVELQPLTQEVLLPDGINVTGRVVDSEGNGLADVVVSDGFQCTRTLFDGSYYLESDESAVRFIHVSSPSGYAPPVSNGLPLFYKKLADQTKTAGVYHVADFVLTAVDNPLRATVFFTADPQPRSTTATLDNSAYHSLDCCSDLYLELKETRAAISGRQVFGICLGDLTHQNMSLLANYANGLKTLGYPTYNVIGNHDNDPSAADDDAGALPFENRFGPRNYSFNVGNIHFVIVDNLIMHREDNLLTAYDQGLSDQVWEWLKADLSYVPKSKTICICAHSPMFKTRQGERTANHKSDYAALLTKYANVHAWAGHTHVTHNYVYPPDGLYPGLEVHTLARSTGELWTNEYLAEGTPRGFTIVEIENGDIASWRFHPQKYQNASFVGRNNSSYSAPAYTSRDWNYVSGVAKMKDTGATLDESYQMHVYAPVGTYGDGKVYANIFLWDNLWGTPTFTLAGGSPVEMTLVEDTNRYDFANTEFRTYYKAVNSTLHASADYKASITDSPNTLFSVPCSATSGSGTVSVTDRFGNTYTRTISW